MPEEADNDIIHRELDTTAESPATEIAVVVADLEGKDATDLMSTYECIDGALDKIFSNPPVPEAQLQVTFNYEGYRITVEQDGSAKFEKIE